ncbi:MAG: phosphate signaling complex protein PhoU [Bacillota bacterium]|nr:phosphate signaling complex protein PhoU [Bacillota bacterium]
MTRRTIDTSIEKLRNDLIEMADNTKEQIENSIDALANKDGELAEQVMEKDDILDRSQREIEDKCIKLIATEQPMAIDLRTVFTIAKVTADLERMADYAVDIAKITLRLKDEDYIKPLIDIPKMSKIVAKMIKESVDAFTKKDVIKSYKICKMDDEVDEIYRKVFSELLIMMSKDLAIQNRATQLLFVIKYLERVADHATNICEGTIYLVTGEYEALND